MDTQYNEQAVRWHLTYNFIPAYSKATINKIVGIYLAVQAGKMQLTDYIMPRADITIGEMFDNLKLDY